MINSSTSFLPIHYLHYMQFEAGSALMPFCDSWQVAYVWAFIVKFDQRDKIRKLECLEEWVRLVKSATPAKLTPSPSFERCLTEPVANRPDDILEGILIRFLASLKPGLRNLEFVIIPSVAADQTSFFSCTNIQTHLSTYISDMLLNSPDFTVWDRPWAPNEEARAGCCNLSEGRYELGRLRYAGEPLADRLGKNPIKRMAETGGGLFELDWRERAKLLRQLVDWQREFACVIGLTESGVFRADPHDHQPGVQSRRA